MIRMANNQVFSRRRVLVAGLAASALLSVPALAQAEPQVHPVRVDLPAPTGRYKLGTTELHLIDRKRNDPTAPGGKRELMVSIWYPARTGSHGPVAK